MQLAQDREQPWAGLRAWRSSGLTTALVPTMGNLHDGHLALVRVAREHADRVVASIYVNPTQFGEGEDYGRYPRTPEEDLSRLESTHCDMVFMPEEQAMYPRGLTDSTRVTAAPSLSGILEGASRPGHFDGVVTVVARLFNLVGPDVAVFGEKDYQQLLVIRRLVEDLGYPIRIVSVPIVRGSGGLALSSRNRYLDAGERLAAEQMNAVLAAAAGRLASSSADPDAVARDARQRLENAGLVVDYVVVRRADDLTEPNAPDTNLRILAAVRCGDTRLIDNVPCRPT